VGFNTLICLPDKKSHSRETNLANHVVDDSYTSRSRDGNESEAGSILDERLTTNTHQCAWTMSDPRSGLNGIINSELTSYC
jgi:hypothetical protein